MNNALHPVGLQPLLDYVHSESDSPCSLLHAFLGLLAYFSISPLIRVAWWNLNFAKLLHLRSSTSLGS